MEKISAKLFSGIISGIAIIAIAAGCGTSSTTATSPAGTSTMPAGGGTGATGMMMEMTMKNTRFSQPEMTMDVGSTMKWTNADSVDHTVTADDGKFDSGNMGKGESFSYTFNEPGTYSYKCTIHPSQMQGTITVK